ncbi:MAG: NAD(P)-dependent dehydrogenase (short-subunit alcohol dehydrogenase family) [Chlamydiales bacterium]|jgi:NAD(P)-dependent dehydrogenase (short-subunit alcohol dehydrogenase family)
MFDKNILQGQAGIITGGTSGIGFAIAKYLLEHGAKVTITGRNEEKMEAAVAELGENASGVIGDVRKSDEIASNVDRHMEQNGKIDFLINNAAGNFLCPLEGMTENAFRSVYDIVGLGTFLWSQAVHPHMKKQKAGRIINTGTTYAFGHGALVGHSGAAKAAVLNLTKTMAVEWGPQGILTNMIAPGPVEGTEGVKKLMGDERAQRAMMPFFPVKRMAEGWEIGALATFLLSPLSAYINGVVIPIDGGLHLTSPGLIPPIFPPEALNIRKPKAATA